MIAMKFEDINIGLLIEQRMNELGINKSEMARRTGIANQNINRVLEKSSIDTEKLIKISEALDYNFFNCFNSIDTIDIVTASNGGVAISKSSTRDVSVASPSDNQVPILEERIKHLEALLAEKERMIQFLMERK